MKPEHHPDYGHIAVLLLCMVLITLLFTYVVIPLLAKLESCMKARVLRKNNLPPNSDKKCVCGCPLFIHNDDDTEPGEGWCAGCECKKFRSADAPADSDWA